MPVPWLPILAVASAVPAIDTLRGLFTSDGVRDAERLFDVTDRARLSAFLSDESRKQRLLEHVMRPGGINDRLTRRESEFALTQSQQRTAFLFKHGADIQALATRSRPSAVEIMATIERMARR